MSKDIVPLICDYVRKHYEEKIGWMIIKVGHGDPDRVYTEVVYDEIKMLKRCQDLREMSLENGSDFTENIVTETSYKITKEWWWNCKFCDLLNCDISIDARPFKYLKFSDH